MIKFSKVPLGLIFISLSLQAFATPAKIIDKNDSIRYYLSKNEFEIDKNASAIILYESGHALLQNDLMTYKVEHTIKVLKQSALTDIGMVSIPAFSNTTVRRVTGTTYNLEGDQIIKQEVRKADIIKDKITNNYYALKFNLPSLKEGSIVHFSYTLEYRTYSRIPDWYFQHQFPTLFSMYQASIPVGYRYADMSRTNIPFEKVNREEDLFHKESAVFNIAYGGSKSDITTWVRRSIPAIKNEVFRKGENHYLDRIQIYITGIFSSWDLQSKLLMNGELLANKNNLFPKVYDPNLFANNRVKELTEGTTDGMEKAKAIYSFVRNNFILADYQNKNHHNIRKAFLARKGNQIEINQILITMLMKAGLNAELVMMSTKPNEPLNPIFPDYKDVNYFITKVEINKNDYFLDPTQKYLPFGQLLPKCYNGYSRIISKNWREIYIDDHLLQDKILVMATLRIDTEQNKMLLTIDKKLNDVTAFLYRSNWMGDEEKALKELRENFLNDRFKIENINVQHISEPDQDLRIRIEASAVLGTDNEIFINAYFDKFFKTNPLPAVERHYPIVFDYKYNYNYLFNLQLPAGYIIEHLPASKRIGLEQGAMIFSSQLAADESKKAMTLNSKFETHQNSFEPEEYGNMRSLFETMLTEQNKNIIIKKEI